VATSREGAIVALGFDEQWPALTARLTRRYGPVTFARSAEAEQAAATLERYLEGDVHALDVLRVDPGGSTFQRRVWTALRDIPPRTTCSYSEIAKIVGAPRSVRAVAAANARNPVSLVVPCHRVVGQDGSLRGYAGGIERKRWLLEHEEAFPTSRPARRTSRAVAC
jgi:methylated-DNA-[protein]-cysteine S-methyltransferase